MTQAIEKHQGTKGFSPHYVLEMSLVCKNCGTAKGRWVAASDGPTSFPFILTMCEYCGCFRFEAVLFAKFYEKQDDKNVAKHKARLNSDLQADYESKRRLEGPKVIKKVEGERLCPECGEPHKPLPDGTLCHSCTS
jgi:ribosomal protein L44E